MHRTALTLAGLVFTLAAGPRATSAQSTTSSVTANAPEPTAGQLAAARELLQVLDMERVSMAGVETMLDAQFGQNPAMGPYRDVARAWAKKHMTWETMGDRLTRVYASAFTERELREIVAFYKTPTGRKLALATPTLMQGGAAIGAQVAQENIAELQQMMEARRAELQAAGKPPER